MTLIAMGIAGLVFFAFAMVFIVGVAVLIKKVMARSKEAGVNLKDGVSSDELATIGRLLAEEAAASKELELLSRIKDVAEKALLSKAKP